MVPRPRSDHPGRLVTLSTVDGIELAGAFYQADESAAEVAAVLHLHGKGGNFYSGPTRGIPAAFAGNSLTHLAMNLRSHDLGYTSLHGESLDRAAPQEFAALGGMWELLEEGVADIEACLSWLEDSGFTSVYVLAHSASALPLAKFVEKNPNRLVGRILLSPLMSGKRVLSRWFPDSKERERVIHHAKMLVARNEAHQLLPVQGWYYAISAESLLERAAEADGWWTEAMEADGSPCQFIWGGLESRADAWRQALDALDIPYKTSTEIKHAGHFFLGQERSVANAINEFVADTLPGTAYDELSADGGDRTHG